MVLLAVVGLNPEVLLCMLCLSQPWGALSISAVGVSFVKVWGFCFDSLNCGGMKDLSNVGIIDLK